MLFSHLILLFGLTLVVSLMIPDHALEPTDQPIGPMVPQQYGSRTPMAIVWSCISVLTLCTWVAIHPNVPPRGQGYFPSLWRRVKLMLWTLVVPELMLLWAYRQWAAARFISELFKAEDWTMAHGHFLIMGGFTLVRNGHQTVLNSESLLTMDEEQTKIAFPPISAAEINDKAKSDFFSKLFVVFQSTWFIVQCISRYKEGLALTEVELVTLASASLTGIMYFFWWHKPFDVQEPIKVYPVGVHPPTKVIRLQSKASSNSPSHPLKRIGSSIFEFLGHLSLCGLFSSVPRISLSPIKTLLPEQRKELWELAAKDHLKFFYVSLYVFILAPIVVLSQTLFAIATTTTIKGNAQNVPAFYAPPTKSDSKILLFLLTIVAASFGGLHLIPWTYDFPSVGEQLLWRICSGAITLIPLVALMIAGATGMNPTTRVSTPIPPSLKTITARKFGFMFLACGAFVAFMLARLALLIEAVVLLRNQPETAFYTVNWTNYLPHV